MTRQIREYGVMKQEVDSRIKVMRIITRMNVGGPAVQVSGLMENLDKKEFNQILLSGECLPSEEEYTNPSGLNIKYVKIIGLGRTINLLDDLKAFVGILRYIKEFQPDVIHTHTAKAGVLGRIASLFSGVGSIRIHTFHGHLLYGYFNAWKRQAIILIERALGRKTHYLLSVGARVRSELLEVKIGRPEFFGVMPPGLELNAIPLQHDARKDLDLDTSSPRLIGAYIGRVTQIKRPDRFLDVVEELSRKGVPVSFLVAGSGELFSECEMRVSKAKLPVRFLGWVSNVEQILAASDFVILTSDNEGMPLSLIQAGMAGKPVVATNVGSVDEVVMNSYTGIVTTKSVEAIVEGIERLVFDETTRSQLGRNAINFTMEKFSLKRLTKDHENLYRHLIFNRANYEPKFPT